MLRSFVSTVKWVALSVQAHTNRCAALLSRTPQAAANTQLRAMPPKELPTIPEPPPIPAIPNFHQGLPFDPATFDVVLSVYAMRVPPPLCNKLRAALKSHILQLPRTPSVEKPPREQGSPPPFIYIMLRYLSAATDEQVGNLSSDYIAGGANAIVDILRAAPKREHPPHVANYLKQGLEEALCVRQVTLSYAKLSYEAVLRRVLPQGVTVPTSFETVGSLIHLNLRPEHEPHKRLIGAVLLDKHRPRVRTVVNKTADTGGPYRTFPLEVLAGERSTQCEVRENGCIYAMDFAAVYWNSRLETEHRRVVDTVREGEIFADAFAGIGPFAIPIAKRGQAAAVYANDLNPSSVAYLARNAARNGVQDKVEYSCGCARDFLASLVARRIPVAKIVMNFPAGAPEFLDVLRGLYVGAGELPMPTVFCYCFVRNDLHEARARVRAALFDGRTDPSETMPDEALGVRRVRDVAPNKIQVCVTFTVPKEAAYAETGAARKKVKVMVPE